MPIPLFIVAGQSNAVGASTSVNELPVDSPLRKPQPNVLFFGPTHETPAPNWAPIVPPTETEQALTGPADRQGFGCELSLGAEYLRLSADVQRVAVVKYAINGSNLHHEWEPTRADSYFARMIARTRRAIDAGRVLGLDLVPAGMVWVQGESDTAPPDVAHAYASNLQRLIDATRRELAAPRLHVVIVQIDHAQPGGTPTVRAHQARVALDDPHASLVSTDDVPRSTYPNDLIHFGTSGILLIGERAARALHAARAQRK